MHRPPLATLALTLVPLLGACGGGGAGGGAPAPSPEVDVDRSVDTVMAEAAKLDRAQLEAGLAAYGPAVDQARAAMEAAVEAARALSPGQLLSARGDDLTREAERLRSRYNALEARRKVYERELARREG